MHQCIRSSENEQLVWRIKIQRVSLVDLKCHNLCDFTVYFSFLNLPIRLFLILFESRSQFDQRIGGVWVCLDGVEESLVGVWVEIGALIAFFSNFLHVNLLHSGLKLQFWLIKQIIDFFTPLLQKDRSICLEDECRIFVTSQSTSIYPSFENFHPDL